MNWYKNQFLRLFLFGILIFLEISYCRTEKSITDTKDPEWLQSIHLDSSDYSHVLNTSIEFDEKQSDIEKSDEAPDSLITNFEYLWGYYLQKNAGRADKILKSEFKRDSKGSFRKYKESKEYRRKYKRILRELAYFDSRPDISNSEYLHWDKFITLEKKYYDKVSVSSDTVQRNLNESDSSHMTLNELITEYPLIWNYALRKNTSKAHNEMRTAFYVKYRDTCGRRMVKEYFNLYKKTEKYYNDFRIKLHSLSYQDFLDGNIRIDNTTVPDWIAMVKLDTAAYSAIIGLINEKRRKELDTSKLKNELGNLVKFHPTVWEYSLTKEANNTRRKVRKKFKKRKKETDSITLSFDEYQRTGDYWDEYRVMLHSLAFKYNQGRAIQVYNTGTAEFEYNIMKQYQKNSELRSLMTENPTLWSYYLNVNANNARKRVRKERNKIKWESLRKYKKDKLYKRDYNAMIIKLSYENYRKDKEEKRLEIRKYQSVDILFVKNKEKLDAVRSKFVISPYLANFFIFHNVNDATADGSYIGHRSALNWQFSIKFPVVVTRNFDNGLFLVFSNRSCFDLRDTSSSRPVSKKSYMPGIFGRFDWKSLFVAQFNRIGIDNETDIGIYHHSNGGYFNSPSRSIMILPYISHKFKALRHKKDTLLNNVYSENYLINLWVRYQWYLDELEENPGIDKEWGNFEAKITFEKAFKLNRNNFYLMVWPELYASFAQKTVESRSVSLGVQPVSNRFRQKYKIRVPLTYYITYYRGKNEYLEYYNQVKEWFGIGLMLRM